jgi:hypothetical protein
MIRGLRCRGRTKRCVEVRQWWGELRGMEQGEDKLKQFDTEELAWWSERNAGKKRSFSCVVKGRQVCKNES